MLPRKQTRFGSISKAVVTFVAKDGKHESKATVFDPYDSDDDDDRLPPSSDVDPKKPCMQLCVI